MNRCVHPASPPLMPEVPSAIQDKLRMESRRDLVRWLGAGGFDNAVEYLDSGQGEVLDIPVWATLPGWNVRACRRLGEREGIVVSLRHPNRRPIILVYEGASPPAPSTGSRRSILDSMLKDGLEAAGRSEA